MKLAFIGGSVESAIGYTHKIASQMDDRWSVEAGCFSTNSDINIKTAHKWGIGTKRVYSDYIELLKNEIDKLDAVVILTPTPLHSRMVIDALSYGYPVICEKALALSSHEGVQISNALKKTKGFLAVTHNYTGYPMVRQMREMIANGDLGVIHQIHIEMPQESFLRVDNDGEKMIPQKWRLTDNQIPSISLDLGAHLQHLVYFLSNKNPLEVVGEQNNFGWFDNIIDDVVCMAKYSDGLRSRMWYSKTALGHRNGLSIRIYGSKGSLQWYQMEPENIQYNTIDGKCIVLDRSSKMFNTNQMRYNRFKAGHPAGFIEAFANIYVDFADKLLEYKKTNTYDPNWVYGVNQAIKGLLVFEAIDRSSKECKWIKL